MLEQVLNYIHNYFDTNQPKYYGDFSVVDGVISSSDCGDMGLQNGQYFRVIGSVFNDGIWQYGSQELKDETFKGEVWLMAVPPSVIGIVNEIQDWLAKYGNVVDSPYSSESFGGYSYNKAQGLSAGDGGGSASSWQVVFGSRLNAWRKIS